jgi:formamidopyrimidine-DNA glycosylase
MPELPEVETVCAGLRPFVSRQKIKAVHLRRKDLRTPFPKDMAKRLEGRRISGVSRRAKYILLEIKEAGAKAADVCAIHLGMSGRITMVQDIGAYKPEKHDHMIIALENGTGFVFNDARRFGMVFLESAEGLQNHKAFSHLGPEPLMRGFTAKILQQKLAGKKADIKTVIMDQCVVVGVGNIYASEALFQACVSPRRAAGDVGREEAGALVSAIKDVLRRAIEAGGSTLKDYKQADGSLGYFQHRFAVYDRAGQPCPRCGKSVKNKPVIQKIVQAGRATYFCPACQR